jgi:hypothetical protein
MRIFALCATILLAGCVETGDFGRVKSSVWNDAVAATGSIAARVRGEPVSSNLLTDDEQELRNRAWRYLVPSRTRPWLDRLLAELVATRIVPGDMIEPDRTAYFRGLLLTAGRSPVSSYRKLSEDASADLRLVPGFASVAARVLAADRLRLVALGHAEGVTWVENHEARARVAENRCLIAWVVSASAFRLGAYRYALDHLFIQAPGLDAVPTEQTLRRLAEERRALDGLGVPPVAGAACAGPPEPLRYVPRSGVVVSRKG